MMNKINLSNKTIINFMYSFNIYYTLFINFIFNTILKNIKKKF